MLTPEEKAKIEAEEKFRAKIRAKSKNKIGCIPAIFIVIIGVILIRSCLPSTPEIISVVNVVSAEIVALKSDDNYHLEPYLILRDENKKEIRATGKATIELTIKEFGKPEKIISKITYQIKESEFKDVSRGIGSFSRASIIRTFPKFNTEKYSRESGSIYLTFIQGKKIIKAKDSVYYP
jgi:hypothetical protein